MFCKQCGNELKTDAGFCPFCGAQIPAQEAPESTEPAPTPEPPEQPVSDLTQAAEEAAPAFTPSADDQAYFAQAQPAGMPTAAAPAKKNKNKLFGILAAAAVALIALVVVLVLALSSKSKQNKSYAGYGSGEDWQSLTYGDYLDTVRVYFEENLSAGANIQNEGSGVFSILSDQGETLCEVRGAFGSGIGEGEENLTVDYHDTDAYTDETSKASGAVAYCSAFAAPYVAGLTGTNVAAADIANTIKDKMVSGEYTEFTRGDGGLAVELRSEGIPIAFFLYNDYDARLCVGSTPIEQHKLSLGLDVGSPASDNTSGNDNDTGAYSGTDAETFASLVVRYYKESVKSDIRSESTSDGNTIFFYLPDGESAFMYVTLEDANDLSKGIGIHVADGVADSYIEQGKQSTVLIMMAPCAAAYLNITEDKNVTLKEVSELILNNAEQSGSMVFSDFKYGSSGVAASIMNMGTGWTVFTMCKKY